MKVVKTQPKKYKLNVWMDLKTGVTYYAVDVVCTDGETYHFGEGKNPLMYKTRKEASAKIRQLNLKLTKQPHRKQKKSPDAGDSRRALLFKLKH